MPDDPLLEQVLHGRSPAEAAQQLVAGSKLADVSVRRTLAEGGLAAIETSDDPMIKLALAVDADARAVRKIHEDQVEGVEDASYALIAKANLRAEGRRGLSGRDLHAPARVRRRQGLQARTAGRSRRSPRIGGAFAHAKSHGDKPPYELPKSWFEAREAGRLALDTPLNFVSTADIIGGNSGSPVVNRDNEIVGLIFDGNIQSLVLDFGYDDRVARAVSVDSRGIIEALRSIYQRRPAGYRADRAMSGSSRRLCSRRMSLRAS